MSNIEIICENISKSFSRKCIFKNLSFKLSTSQSITISGRNGSGKSTLLKIIANLTRSSNGKVSIIENNILLSAESRFRKIGFLSPYLNLYDELTGFENLDFFYRLRSFAFQNSKEKINSLLESAGLYQNRNELLKNYSSGMKQRLKLMFAIMHEPEILLMDEPRTNLDKSGINLIRRFSEEQKLKGILIIATNDESDKELCDHTLNIEDYN